jgi:FKBP-type peptidyl-prolyl cis-trans isomerase FklB
MNVGAKWKVVVPPELAYGELGAGPAIEPNSTLVFDIELIEIS